MLAGRKGEERVNKREGDVNSYAVRGRASILLCEVHHSSSKSSSFSRTVSHSNNRSIIRAADWDNSTCYAIKRIIVKLDAINLPLNRQQALEIQTTPLLFTDWWQLLMCVRSKQCDSEKRVCESCVMADMNWKAMLVCCFALLGAWDIIIQIQYNRVYQSSQ